MLIHLPCPLLLYCLWSLCSRMSLCKSSKVSLNLHRSIRKGSCPSEAYEWQRWCWDEETNSKRVGWRVEGWNKGRIDKDWGTKVRGVTFACEYRTPTHHQYLTMVLISHPRLGLFLSLSPTLLANRLSPWNVKHLCYLYLSVWSKQSIKPPKLVDPLEQWR